MCLWPKIHVQQQTNILMHHTAFARFALHYLHIFMLKPNFLYVLQQCDAITFFIYFLAKENPAGVYILFPGINLGNYLFWTRWPTTPRTAMPVKYLAFLSSELELEKADQQLHSVGAFWLSATYLHLQLYSFHLTKVLPETICGNSTLTLYRRGRFVDSY